MNLQICSQLGRSTGPQGPPLVLGPQGPPGQSDAHSGKVASGRNWTAGHPVGAAASENGGAKRCVFDVREKNLCIWCKKWNQEKKNHTVLDTNFCGSREDPRVLVCARPRKQTAAGRPESRRSDPLQRGGGGWAGTRGLGATLGGIFNF